MVSFDQLDSRVQQDIDVPAPPVLYRNRPDVCLSEFANVDPHFVAKFAIFNKSNGEAASSISILR